MLLEKHMKQKIRMKLIMKISMEFLINYYENWSKVNKQKKKKMR